VDDEHGNFRDGSVLKWVAYSCELTEFNADGLRATCEAVSVGWFDVLDGL
jgi:hypothetical protein